MVGTYCFVLFTAIAKFKKYFHCMVDMYKLHHDVEVDMGFTQPRAEGLRIVRILYRPNAEWCN